MHRGGGAPGRQHDRAMQYAARQRRQRRADALHGGGGIRPGVGGILVAVARRLRAAPEAAVQQVQNVVHGVALLSGPERPR